eukprot:6198566-Pleurochrysis_carterae.AAC.5
MNGTQANEYKATCMRAGLTDVQLCSSNSTPPTHSSSSCLGARAHSCNRASRRILPASDMEVEKALLKGRRGECLPASVEQSGVLALCCRAMAD